MVKPLKVLYVLRPISGGMRYHSLGLLHLLDSHRFHPYVICPPGDQGIQTELNSDIPIFTLDIQGEISPAIDLRHAWTIAKIAKDLQVDIIHAHGYKATSLCLWPGLRHTGTQLICTFHNQFRKGLSLPEIMFQSVFGGWVNRCYDYIVTVSNALLDQAVQQWGLSKTKVRCIYNGIDLAPFQRKNVPALRRELGLKEDVVLIGTTARLIPQKGIDYLIAAAKRLVVEFPSLQFIVAGDGPDFDRLQYKIDQQNLGQSFKLLGFRKDMPEVLASIDIFALPTLEEGFSIAALEAMAAEKPIVASRVGGVPEVVNEDVGVLVPPGQVDALYHALRHLILEKADRVRLGLAGRSRVESTFSLRRMVDEHENIYESLTMHERLTYSV